LQPSEIGIESTAAAARRGGTFFNQAAAAITSTGQHFGEALKTAGDAAINYQQHREISAGAAKLAQIEDSQTGVWQQTLANKGVDWNDPTIAQQFRAGMEPTLQGFKDSFLTAGGRDWAESRVEDFRKHMFAKTAADSSTMAGAAVAQNLEQSVISYSNRVFKDPGIETLNDALNSFHSAAEASVYSSPTLAAGSRASILKDIFKQDEKIVKSAIMGAIKQNGDWHTIADDPRFSKYITGPEMAQFARQEEVMQRVIERDDRSARAEQRRVDQQDAMNRADNLRTQFINAETGEYSFPKNFRQQVLTDPVLAKYPAARVALLRDYDQIERGTKDTKLATKSLQAWRTLAGQINRGEITNEQPILDQIENLTRTDLNDLVKRLQESRSPDGQTIGKDRDNFIKKFGPLIDGDYKFQYQQHSLLGSQQMYQFEWDARAKENAVRQAGRDPHGVYNPSSPDYFGAPANIARYRVSAQEAQAYEKLQKDIDKATSQENKNLTGPGKTITGTQVIDIPPGMTPAQALEWARDNNVSVGTSLRLPDGRIRPMPPEPPKAAGPEVPKGR
jgi:hypothetical protein